MKILLVVPYVIDGCMNAQHDLFGTCQAVEITYVAREIVARRKTPTVRSVWLGEALKEIRDAAGLTAKDAGAHLGRDGSSITRMEAGEIPVSEGILIAFMEMCGINDPHRRAELETIRRDVAQAGWWDGYSGDLAPQLMDRAWMESKAQHIETFDITNLPGLLQTPEYAEGVMRAVAPDTPQVDIIRWLEVRMTRQHVLSKHHPVTLDSIIDERLLTRRVGNADVMLGQLNYLLDASRRKNIEIRILPGDRYFGMPGSFEVFELKSPYPRVGYVSCAVGDICVEGAPVGQLADAYDRIRKSSLSLEASRRLMIAERDNLQ